MPRPENPIDPDAGPLQHFAFDLRKLREQAGSPTYRAMARRAHFSQTTLQQAAAGRTFPSLAVTLAFVEVCRGDRGEWEARWHAVNQALAGQLAATAASRRDQAPYLGLEPYRLEDAGRYFGRERLVSELVGLLATRRFLAVFGDSGSGKSSLLGAGLWPAIQAGRLPGSQDWPVAWVTPGEHPLEELAVQVGRSLGVDSGTLHANLEHRPASLDLAVRQAMAGKPTTVRLVLIVDQFEQIFTLCADENERAAFIHALLDATRGPPSRACAVLGVRSDYFRRFGRYPRLVEAVSDAPPLIGPMTDADLRAAVTRPLAGTALKMDPALVETVLADARDEPGALPMVSHALLETWRRPQGVRLTLTGYHEAGGVHGAIAQTAEDAYLNKFDPGQQQIAKEIFVRLASLEEGAGSTRRRASLDDLAGDARRAETAAVLELLAADRLITLGEDTVQVAHEALIRAWPRLDDWLAEDRDWVQERKRLNRAAQEWDDLRRDPGGLYRGARLVAARDRAAGREHELNDLERDFLHASVASEAGDLSRARRNNRRLRGLAAALGVLAVIAGVAGALALRQSRNAQRQETIAESRQLAAQAEQIMDSRPSTALLLGAEAYATAANVETRTSLLNGVHDYQAVRAILHHLDAVRTVAFSPDGATVASGANDGTVILWDAASRRRRAVLTNQTGVVQSVTFHPDGDVLAAGGADGTVALWDVGGGRRLATLRGSSTAVRSVAFGLAGEVLAAGGADGSVVLWDVGRRGRLATLSGHRGTVNQVVVSRDGRQLASAGEDGTIVLWDLERRVRVATLRHGAGPVRAVAFGPDGKTLAAGGPDGTVTLWDVAGRVETATLAGTDPVADLAFSSDSTALAVAGSDGVTLWDLPRQVPTTVFHGHTLPVASVAFAPDGATIASGSYDRTVIISDRAAVPITVPDTELEAVAFSPDGRTLATGGTDHAVTLWDANRRTRTTRLEGHTRPVLSVAFSPDGQLLASAGEDRTVILWEVASGRRLGTLSDHTDTVSSVAFSPDGTTLASGSFDATVRLWNVADPTHVATLTGHRGLVEDVAFSPDGKTLASGGFDRTVILWKVASGRRLVTLRGHTDTVSSVAFSPDGATVASGALDATVRLWDPSHPGRQVTLRGSPDAVTSVAFRPDGAMLASGSSDTVRLWDVAERRHLATLIGHTGPVQDVAFSPSSRSILASVSTDGTGFLRETSAASASRHVCGVVARNLTQSEWIQFQRGRGRRETCHVPGGQAADRDGARMVSYDDLPADLAAAREDGADPGRAGCGGDAVTLERVNIPLRPGVNLGTVELRHSADCAASWGRFIPTNPIIDTLGPVTVRVVAERPDDTITAPWSAPYLGLQVYGALLRADQGCVRVRVEIRPHTGGPSSAATSCHRP